jgi:hypothetical protein
MSLQELFIFAGAKHPQRCSLQNLEALLRAAPQLRTLEAVVYCENAEEAHRVLRNAPPFGPLRVRQLLVGAATTEATADAVLALAADLAAHASLASVWLSNAPLNDAAALDAVVDAALARSLTSVRLERCRLSPASASALARLLRGDTLTELDLHGVHDQLLDAPAAALLANALRTNTSLTALTLHSIDLWRDAAAAAALLAALTAHPRLRLLDLTSNWPHNDGLQAPEVGAALAALLLANAPALQTLDIGGCLLSDVGMGPVVEALRHNTHLTKLDCSSNRTSAAFARERLLPAVRANTSLRELAASSDERRPAAREAVALVAARSHPQ